MRQLNQQTAIITGASRGIGRALALALGRAGAQLVLIARSSANLHSVAAELKLIIDASGTLGQVVIASHHPLEALPMNVMHVCELHRCM
ncbi:hypothetical protein A9Q02_16470 [Candidatus Chloroploca asiatica]|uniref:Short-chain dehydrogenase n=2 Tax=Candidatus Chloroploca asiatica TaxID=1506545 RepID=A0A2H3KK11_9CHLR|nr:hypothetical protein A9Q02_16470 [Candidatus Chloroploca asiatica]